MTQVQDELEVELPFGQRATSFLLRFDQTVLDGVAMQHQRFELTNALEVEPSAFTRQIGEPECRPSRHRVPMEYGEARRVRGYFTADIRAAIDRAKEAGLSCSTEAHPGPETTSADS